jgi:hypothetical protein
MAPPKRKGGRPGSQTPSGRVTPKGTRPGDTPRRADPVADGDPEAVTRSSRTGGAAAAGHPGASTRYTPPTVKKADLPSPVWVPVLMWTLLGGGGLAILVNYTEFVWDQNGWVLLGGLAAILGGILTATQYR